MAQDEKLLLEIKASRISSIKSLFFPMEYRFYEIDGQLCIFSITKNWIGQKTSNRDFSSFFRAKGLILRKLYFVSNMHCYGRFWGGDVRKAKKLLEQYTPTSSRLEWSDAWF